MGVFNRLCQFRRFDRPPDGDGSENRSESANKTDMAEHIKIFFGHDNLKVLLIHVGNQRPGRGDVVFGTDGPLFQCYLMICPDPHLSKKHEKRSDYGLNPRYSPFVACRAFCCRTGRCWRARGYHHSCGCEWCLREHIGCKPNGKASLSRLRGLIGGV